MLSRTHFFCHVASIFWFFLETSTILHAALRTLHVLISLTKNARPKNVQTSMVTHCHVLLHRFSLVHQVAFQRSLSLLLTLASKLNHLPHQAKSQRSYDQLLHGILFHCCSFIHHLVVFQFHARNAAFGHN